MRTTRLNGLLALCLVLLTTGLFAQRIPAGDVDFADQLGNDVAISGNYAIAGAYYDDNQRRNANQRAGAAYIYENVGGNWNQMIKITATERRKSAWFGHSVDISGNWAIVGAPNEKEDANDGGRPITKAGAAYMYRLVGNQWVFFQKIVSPDRSNSDNFGWDVAVNGRYVLVSATGEDEDANGVHMNNAGAVYVFRLVGNAWTMVSKLVAPDRTPNQTFGRSIEVDVNGRIIVGTDREKRDIAGLSPFTNCGAAYIYEETSANSNNWTVGQKLVHQPVTERGTERYFGYSVAIDGDIAVVGAYLQPTGGVKKGAVYIYVRIGGFWQAMRNGRITMNDAVNADKFGYSVDLSGSNLVVGCPWYDRGGRNGGAAFVYNINPPLDRVTLTNTFLAANGSESMGWSVGMDGGQVIAGAYSATVNNIRSAGVVYFFR